MSTELNTETQTQSLFQLQISAGSLEICLGKTQQWMRMLRGQGQELRKVPGFFGLAAQPETGQAEEQAVAPVDWQLCEWQFENFASRPLQVSDKPQVLEGQGISEEYYFAIAPVAKLLFGQNPAIFAALRPVSQLSDEELLQSGFLQILLSFLDKLCQQPGYQQQGIIWDSLLWANTEGHYLFVLLPPELAFFVAWRSPLEVRLQHFIPYQLPAAPAPKGTSAALAQPSDSQRWAYALAALIYYRLSGEQAFNPHPTNKLSASDSHATHAAEEERLHDAVTAMRHGDYIEAGLFRPELNPTFNQLLKQTLCAPLVKTSHSSFSNLGKRPSDSGQQSQESWPSLPDWQQALFAEDGPVPLWRDCDNEQRQQAAVQLEQDRKQRQQNWQRKRFWRKKSSIVAICCALAILLGALIYTPLKRALSPPEHSNLSAYETLSLYYQAIDKLDPQGQSDLNYRGNQVVKADANMLTMLFVNVQTRKGYEGRDVLLKAADWLQKEGLSSASGSPIPALSLDYLPYGITELQISAIQAADGQSQPLVQQLIMEVPRQLLSENLLKNGAQIQLQAQYSLWLPGTFAASETSDAEDRDSSQELDLEQLPKAVQPLHQQVTDLATLIYRARKKAWYVHTIERKVTVVPHSQP